MIKSRVLRFSPCSFIFKSLRYCTTSAKNPTVSLFLSFPKKAENTLAFLHILLTSRDKTKFPSQRTKISTKLCPYSTIFHDCALVNLYNSIVFDKKRFHRYFLALNPLYFHQYRPVVPKRFSFKAHFRKNRNYLGHFEH